jgi:hypothetical protein
LWLASEQQLKPVFCPPALLFLGQSPLRGFSLRHAEQAAKIPGFAVCSYL